MQDCIPSILEGVRSAFPQAWGSAGCRAGRVFPHLPGTRALSTRESEPACGAGLFLFVQTFLQSSGYSGYIPFESELLNGVFVSFLILVLPSSPAPARRYQEFANWLEAGLGHLPPSVGSKARGLQPAYALHSGPSAHSKPSKYTGRTTGAQIARLSLGSNSPGLSS